MLCVEWLFSKDLIVVMIKSKMGNGMHPEIPIHIDSSFLSRRLRFSAPSRPTRNDRPLFPPTCRFGNDCATLLLYYAKITKDCTSYYPSNFFFLTDYSQLSVWILFTNAFSLDFLITFIPFFLFIVYSKKYSNLRLYLIIT